MMKPIQILEARMTVPNLIQLLSLQHHQKLVFLSSRLLILPFKWFLHVYSYFHSNGFTLSNLLGEFLEYVLVLESMLV